MSETISYLTLFHGVAIGACLLLAATHVLLLVRSEAERSRWVNSAVAAMAIAAGAAIYFELVKVLSVDADSYLSGLYGEAIAAFVLLVGILVFARFYFAHSLDWLFWLALVVWSGASLYQIAYFPESFYTDVTGLTTLETSWGEPYSKVSAAVSNIKYTTDIGTLLVLAYVTSATVVNYRRGNTRAALTVGGAIVGFMVVAGILVPLDDAGLLRNTMPIGLPFLGIVIMLTYQLIDDQARTNRLRLEVEQLRRGSLAGEIAAGLMHELRQPLTSILSNSQAASRFLESDDPDLAEVRDALDDIITEDKRAAEIISGLRTFLGQEQLEASEFDLNTAIKRVANMLLGEFNTNGSRLTLNLHTSPLPVVGSEVQIEQVVINLAMNSLRALRGTSRGERVVHIESTARDGSAELIVADSGPGIAQDIRSQLFQPFKSGGSGMGMGLAICKRIVDSHDGTIRADDSELGGARFVIVLPLAESRSSDA